MNRRFWTLALAAATLLPLGAVTAHAQGGADSGGSGGGGGGGGGTVATASADLQVSGSASTSSPDPGSAFTYSFLVKNSGGSTATNVVLTNPVPSATTPNWATMNGSVLPCVAIGDPAGGLSYQCTIGTIVKGGQATVVISVTAPEVAQSFTDTASVTSDVADPVLTNNAKTVSVTVKAPTGGVCKGGVCDTVPAPIAAPCVTLTSVTAPVGYYSVWAAVWNDFTLQSCSTGSESVTVQVTETNVSSGSVDYNAVLPVSLLSGQNLSYILDNDFAPFNTTYRIDYTVRDSSGNVLATASTTATTPAPR